jgi:leucyl aminopeptidase
MLDLPEFQPLAITHRAGPASLRALDAIDHLLIVTSLKPAAAGLRDLPAGAGLQRLLARRSKSQPCMVSTRLDNRRATGVSLATFRPQSAFATLTWARETIAECLRQRAGTLGLLVQGLEADDAAAARHALIAACEAVAFRLPEFKTTPPAERVDLTRLVLFSHAPDAGLAAVRAAALGNNIARWFTALPPNKLTARSYRAAIEKLAKPCGLRVEFLSERRLRSLGAGAFLAVSQGNADRDAGIVHIRYEPERKTRAPALALVGKGILFDTGGTNLKPFKSMLDMHIDMQGSAVALGSLIALASLRVPYAVDAWLALTENRISAEAYKPQDVVQALNGTTIQIIHTDAEGRMVLADTLALAARRKPALMIDYATLTGSCIAALTERYSGVFSNRIQAAAALQEAGIQSGERVWCFPMDPDFDEALRSETADIKQCSADGQGDHILAARFLSRFVPDEIPWIHMDLSAGQHKGGLAQIPTEITGFGVRWTLQALQALQGSATGLEPLLARLGPGER